MSKLIQLPNGSGWPRPAVPEEEKLDAEGDYEDQLIGLLARLDHVREGLASAVAARRPALAMTRAGELMGHLTAFGNRHFPFAGPEVRDALARVAEFKGGLDLLREPGRAGEEDARQAVTRRCFAALCESVLAYFTAFTNRFPTSRAARGWVEVAATFAADLKRSVRDPVPIG
jgi:hypothetical protein